MDAGDLTQTMAQAREKLKVIEQHIEATKRAIVAKVGSGQPP